MERTKTSQALGWEWNRANDLPNQEWSYRSCWQVWWDL